MFSTQLFEKWETATPYSLRGFHLGVDLAAVRGLTHPDQTDARLLCSSETGAKDAGLHYASPLLDSERDAGAIACGHVTPSSASLPTWVRMTVADVATHTTFSFVPDQANVMRLYKIAVRAGREHWWTSLMP